MIRRSLLAFALTLAAALPALAESYEIDNVHSSVIFKIKHLDTGYVFGRFNQLQGTLETDEQAPTALTATVAAESIDTHNEKRDQHLKGPDFFDAKRFPNIEFKTTGIEPAGEGKYEATGELTLHGVTKPITVVLEKVGQGEDPWGKFRQGYITTFTVNRMDYGVDYMPDGLSHDVELTIAFEAVRQ